MHAAKMWQHVKWLLCVEVCLTAEVVSQLLFLVSEFCLEWPQVGIAGVVVFYY